MLEDNEYEDRIIKKVEPATNDGWAVRFSDGLLFFVDGDSPVVPAVEMRARTYGKGFGCPIRGLYLNGVKIFYRTEPEQKEHEEVKRYGKDAADWLKKWDNGEICWSIEMGGLGPGYEQCIHITAAEIIRFMLQKQYDPSTWDDPVNGKEVWNKDRDEIHEMSFTNSVIQGLGLSGAQWGAALNIALNFYRRGPRVALTDERVKERLIMVSKNFPG